MKTSHAKKIHIKSSKLMNSLFAGNFKAAFSGKGIEFQDFREYSYGDDAKYIDWLTSSREWTTIMRRYREEKQWNILCIADNRESLMFWNWEKRNLLQEVVHVLYHASSSNGESFGWYILDEMGETYIPPKKNPVNLYALEKLSVYPRKISETLSIDFVMKNKLKRSIIFILTDSMNIDEKSFKIAALKHDIIFVHISSHFENTLEWDGISSLRWENRWVAIDLWDSEKKQIYIDKRKQKLSDFSIRLKRLWIDSIYLDEYSSIFATFLWLMKLRERS